MALVKAVLEVLGVLAAVGLLLWFSTVIEARHLGPVSFGVGEPEVGAAEVGGDLAVGAAPAPSMAMAMEAPTAA